MHSTPCSSALPGEFFGKESVVSEAVDLPDDVVAGKQSLKEIVQVRYAGVDIQSSHPVTSPDCQVILT